MPRGSRSNDAEKYLTQEKITAYTFEDESFRIGVSSNCSRAACAGVDLLGLTMTITAAQTLYLPKNHWTSIAAGVAYAILVAGFYWSLFRR